MADELRTREEMGKPEYANKGGAMRRPRRAKGGSTKVNEYNAQGSPEMAEVKDESETFKKGGHAKRKAGGMAEGEMPMPRADKAPRGRPHRAMGGSVYSSGSKLDAPKSGDDASRGREGQKVPAEPTPG